MLDFGEHYCKKVRKKYNILDQRCIVKNNEDEMIEVIKNIIQNIPTGMEAKSKAQKDGKDKNKMSNSFNLKIAYINHTKKMPTQKEKSELTLKQYIEYERSTFYHPYYINMNDTQCIQVRFTVMFNPYSYKPIYFDTLMYNTKKELEYMMRNNIHVEMSPNVKMVLDFDKEVDVVEGEDYSLLHELVLNIPINHNGCYIINGRRYYHGYFLHAAEKDIYVNLEKESATIVHNGGSKSFLNFSGNTIVHNVLAVPINPFLYEDICTVEEMRNCFSDYVFTKEQEEQLERTLAAYLKDKADGTLKEPLDKARAEIEPAIVYKAIALKFDMQNHPEIYANIPREMYLSKYYGFRGSHIPNVEMSIRECVPPFKKNEPDKVKARWNVHPNTVLTAIVQRKQFISLENPNPMDIFRMLYFTVTEGKDLKESNRYVTDDKFHKVCIIDTPGDIGANGTILPSYNLKIDW